MEILDRQEVRHPRLKPADFGQRLALRAMTIATRVVGDAFVTTSVTLVHMTAEHAGTTDFNSAHHPPLLWRQRVGEPEVGPVLAEDVVHLQRWSHAQKRSALTGYARSSSGLSVARTVFAETLV